MFGFQTVFFCSVLYYFKQAKVFGIQTNCLDFRHKFVSEIQKRMTQIKQSVPILNTNLCLKSEHVFIHIK